MTLSVVPGPDPGPCSAALRLRLLQREDVGSFQNFHSEPGPFPGMEEGGVVLLGTTPHEAAVPLLSDRDGPCVGERL